MTRRPIHILSCAASLALAASACGSSSSDPDGGGDGDGGSGLPTDGGDIDAARPTVDTSNPPSADWAQRFGLAGEDLAEGVAVDSAGNIYMAGTHQFAVSFGGDPQPYAEGILHPYLASFEPDGTYRWSESLGVEGEALVHELVVGPNDEIYWTAIMAGKLSFDGTLLEPESVELFVAKFNSDGAAQWAVPIGGADEDGAPNIAVTASGRVFLAGAFSGTADFGDGQVTASGENDMLVAELNPANGAFLWADTFGGDGRDVPRGIAANSSGVYVSALSSSASLSFGDDSATGQGSNDYLLLKYSPSGSRTWMKHFGTAADEGPNDLALDPAGNLYLNGLFDVTLNLGGDTLEAVPSGLGDLVFASFTGDGDHRWSRRVGGDREGAIYEGHREVAVDRFGHIYFSGTNSASDPTEPGFPDIQGVYDGYVQQVDPGDGSAIWTMVIPGDTQESISGVRFDPAGHLVIIGNYHAGPDGQSEITVGEEVFASEGSWDIFLSRFVYPDL